MNILEDLTIEELYSLKEIISKVDSITDLNELIDKEIDRKSKMVNNLNSFISIDDLGLSIECYKILKFNNVESVSDLINLDTSTLFGVDSSIKKEIEWAKKFFDYSNVNANNLTNKRN